MIQTSATVSEILKQGPYNCAVDLWAIGVVTYIMLCGRMPFDEEHRGRLYRQIIRAKYYFSGEVYLKSLRFPSCLYLCLCLFPSLHLVLLLCISPFLYLFLLLCIFFFSICRPHLIIILETEILVICNINNGTTVLLKTIIN